MPPRAVQAILADVRASRERTRRKSASVTATSATTPQARLIKAATLMSGDRGGRNTRTYAHVAAATTNGATKEAISDFPNFIGLTPPLCREHRRFAGASREQRLVSPAHHLPKLRQQRLQRCEQDTP